MVEIELREFDDELQNMEELMREAAIALTDESLKVPLTRLKLRPALVVDAGTPIKNCIEKMVARHIGCLLVVKEGTYHGIFTERDVLLKIAGEDIDLESATIDDFMSREPISLKIDDSVEKALRLMVERGYRHVCITDANDKPVSLVSIKDIVGFIVEFFPQDILNLPPHPIRVGTKDQYGG